MKITVGFSTPKQFKIGSFGIRKFQGTPYSHTYILVEDPYTSVKLVYEASYGYFHCMSYDAFKQYNTIFSEHEFEISDQEFRNVLIYSQSMLQRHYGYMTVLGILLKSKLGIKGVGDDDDKTIICSEYAYNVLKILNRADLAANADYITPKDVLEIVLSFS